MITVNLYYTGTNGSARAFAAEMELLGIKTFSKHFVRAYGI